MLEHGFTSGMIGWQVWLLIGAAKPNGGFYVITDKPSKNGYNPLRQVRKAGTPTLT